MTLLISSIIALIIGPVIAQLFRSKEYFKDLLDGFILTSIGGLILWHLLPEAFEEIGLWAILIFLLGAVLPGLLERGYHNLERSAHLMAVLMALGGIFTHTILDGIAFSKASVVHGSGQQLAFAVIAHRLPVGLLIYWAIKPFWGYKGIFNVLLVMSLGTILGYSIFTFDVMQGSHGIIGYFQALVTGSLFHVVIHKPFHSHGSHENHSENEDEHHSKLAEIIGGLLGLGILYLISINLHVVEEHKAHTFFPLFSQLFLKSSPALLVGFSFAAFLGAFVSPKSFSWLTKGKTITRILKGVGIGLPLPICSCGVIPLYKSLIKRGVPIGAAMAFLIATPELGIDAFFLSLPLLGVKMAFARIFAAFFVAVFVGWLMEKLFPNGSMIEMPLIGNQKQVAESKFRKFWRIFNFELMDELIPWILFGLVLATVADPLLEHIDWKNIPNGLDVVLMTLIGMPLYICASGATPLAAVFLWNGVSPGAILAFLITGPATNITTFGVLKNIHGRKIATVFPIIIVVTAIAIGLFVNATVSFDAMKPIMIEEQTNSWIEYASAFVLTLFILGSLKRLGFRGMTDSILEMN